MALDAGPPLHTQPLQLAQSLAMASTITESDRSDLIEMLHESAEDDGQTFSTERSGCRCEYCGCCSTANPSIPAGFLTCDGVDDGLAGRYVEGACT